MIEPYNVHKLKLRIRTCDENHSSAIKPSSHLPSFETTQQPRIDERMRGNQISGRYNNYERIKQLNEEVLEMPTSIPTHKGTTRTVQRQSQ